MVRIKGVALCLLALLACTSLRSEVSVPTLFSSHMVLQRKTPVPVWGWADANEKIRVSFNEKLYRTRTDQEGNWKVILNQTMAGGPYQLIVEGKNTLVFEDVWVGEVWLCAGQSNMLFRLSKEENAGSELPHASTNNMKLFRIAPDTAHSPKKEFQQVRWEKCSPETAADFSAVAYYFGKELEHNLDQVPIGLIQAASGSSTAEAWMSREAMESRINLKEHLENYVSTLPFKNPSRVYNAMLHPLLPFTIKGVIWYQGESNVLRASDYESTLPALIADWRKGFHNDELPFYIVQIPPYNYSAGQQETDEEFGAAILRDAQFNTALQDEYCQLIVSTDLGDPAQLHPTNKKTLGKRIAHSILAREYGKSDFAVSGPVYKSHTIERNKIHVCFDYVDNGYLDHGESLIWFHIAGTDRHFYQANAFIEGSDVVVSSPHVNKPVAVRFGWNNVAEPNLFNKEGLPASPFRTDNWVISDFDNNISLWSRSRKPDIRSIPPDLFVPPLSLVPGTGKRVKMQLKQYTNTPIHHILYLPTNWEPGKKYPVIVEYPGNGNYLNKYGDVCTGKPEDCSLGYGISGGKDYIVLSMPFISKDHKDIQLNWWGDLEVGKKYCIEVLKEVVSQYGGDSTAVIITGFSRGAIACNYLGLYDDEIARLWLASIPCSHYDGKNEWSYPNSDKASAIRRLHRLKMRPQLIIQEDMNNLTSQYISATGISGNFSYVNIPFRNHNDTWVLRNTPERAYIRSWLSKIIENR